jgi:hypothetical protein
MSKDPVGYTPDGYSVVINAGRLNETADELAKHQHAAFDARRHLLASLVPEEAFGSIPGGTEAAARLRRSLDAHLDAVQRMGVSLADLAARVDAAAKLAGDAEPATAKVSRIPEVFQSRGD